MVATCGKVTVAEVEAIVAAGEIDPDTIHTPGIFVQKFILATQNETRIEKRVVREAA